MVSTIRKRICKKLTGILSDLPSVTSLKFEALEKQLSAHINVVRVDKSSEKAALVSVNLEGLAKNNILKIQDADHQQKIKNALNDNLIKDSYVKHGKLFIQIDTHEFVKNVLTSINEEKENHGFIQKNIDNKNRNNNTIVEFSSPNIAKPLHAGHMRSTFLGNFISKISKNFGENVIKLNYLGDWGTQYGILAVGFSKYGSMKKLKEAPMKHLLDVYVRANKDENTKKEALEYFSKLEKNLDTEITDQWNLFRKLSIEELTETYKFLDIHFDDYEAESQYFKFSNEIIDQLIAKDICQKKEDNRFEVEFEIANEKKEKVKYVVRKSDGASLYITRDLAALLKRKKKYNFGKIVYVVDSRQSSHFKNLYETVKLIDQQVLGDLSFNEFYVPFGRIRNMSTRNGEIELLSDLIKESKQVALESIKNTKIKKTIDDLESTAQIIGLSHLIINDFLRPRMKDYDFSWANMLKSDNSAYSIHYAHARLANLIEKCQNEHNLTVPSIENARFDLINEMSELLLIQLMANYEEVLVKCYNAYEPYYLVNYLLELIRLMNISFKQNYVIGVEKQVSEARLLMYSCCKQIISNSLRTLGITPLNRV